MNSTKKAQKTAIKVSTKVSTKVSMVSLGCSKNQIDGEIMLAALKHDGFLLCGDVGESDVVIVNTCGFIQAAKEEAIENILELAALKAEGTIKAIIVTGCMAQRYKDEILTEMPEVDAVLGIGANNKISEVITKTIENIDKNIDENKDENNILQDNKNLQDDRISVYGEKENLAIDGERILTTLPYYAYIKIAEGCDNCCSYCAIPSIRGHFRSRTIENIVEEAKLLANQGVKELVVIAQDTTRYGEDIYGEYSLARLLKELSKIEQLVWIRTLYCYPDKITDELLQVMSDEKKVVKYLDIPIQHCNKEILERMNRGISKDELVALIQRIKIKIPDITLRTTLIVGFPGETDTQFEELCDFISEVKFDRLGCFAYSAEDGTPASNFENQIDEDVKKDREEIIMSQQADIMTRKNDESVSKIVTVLVEGFDKFGECYFGRSEKDAPDIDGKIFFTSDNHHEMGDFCKVLINEVMDYDLIGEEIFR